MRSIRIMAASITAAVIGIAGFALESAAQRTPSSAHRRTLIVPPLPSTWIESPVASPPSDTEVRRQDVTVATTAQGTKVIAWLERRLDNGLPPDDGHPVVATLAPNASQWLVTPHADVELYTISSTYRGRLVGVRALTDRILRWVYADGVAETSYVPATGTVSIGLVTCAFAPPALGVVFAQWTALGPPEVHDVFALTGSDSTPTQTHLARTSVHPQWLTATGPDARSCFVLAAERRASSQGDSRLFGVAVTPRGSAAVEIDASDRAYASTGVVIGQDGVPHVFYTLENYYAPSAPAERPRQYTMVHASQTRSGWMRETIDAPTGAQIVAAIASARGLHLLTVGSLPQLGHHELRYWSKRSAADTWRSTVVASGWLQQDRNAFALWADDHGAIIVAAVGTDDRVVTYTPAH
ncbi:MAG: hypothetical protein IPK60_09305 [Sandaracinaceae bacterium]|nr:hypothetical protein [Sandaracinaceae bacterium]